jgi:ATP-dependent Lon protease
MKNDQIVENILFSDVDDNNDNNIIAIPFEIDDDNNDNSEILEDLPILPARNTVLFPGIVMPITVGRKKSIKLIKKAYKGNKLIGVITQHNADAEETPFEELYKIGTLAQIMKIFTMPDGNINIIIQGKKRIQVQEFTSEEPYICARVKTLTENFPKKTKQAKALMSSVKDSAFKIMELNPDIPRDAKIVIEGMENLSFLTHFLCSNLNVESAKKQTLLESNEAVDRITQLLEYMNEEIQHLQIKQEIHSKVHTDIDQQQRDFFLRQQIKIIQDELNGGHENNEMELDTLRKKAQNKKWSEKLAQYCQKEISKITKMNPASAEYPVSLNYIEFLLDLPWNEYTKDNHDLKNAQKILDKDHYGLEKVKERIIEYLAVLKLKNNLKSPILCLYGPPGVGKTSLGKSIAKALNRNYIRMALGGVHDESEIRGHRKTYVGAMAGKILQNIKKSQSSNPVFILDEIDKVSADMRAGDPASALLEVLDPEQNNSFSDNYLDLEYDLSQVLFIATANNLDNIHPALRDRMEIIEITGYTQEEKVQIAKKHIIPEQRSEHGLQTKDLKFEDNAIVKIIADYTRESGVRSLKRKIGAVCRKIAKAIATEENYTKNINEKEVAKLLGTEIFDKEIAENENQIGIVTGLAWTSVGGEILFIEASLSQGKGRLTLSGQLGDVMKESAQTALSFLKSIAHELEIDYKKFEECDLHIHVPAGAVPKDGPSAGITMLTALTSVFANRKVKSHIAMTGEITLRGRVLPVGGIKEKILSAKRAGIKEIILCEKNKRDLEEIPKNYIEDIKFHFVKQANEVLKIVLE